MDRANRDDLLELAPSAADRAKVRLLRQFDPDASPAADAQADLDVPDPYYGGPNGFADVYDIIERSCTGLLDTIIEE
jgi:protein-tyrosine phosphatase